MGSKLIINRAKTEIRDSTENLWHLHVLAVGYGTPDNAMIHLERNTLNSQIKEMLSLIW